MLNVQAINTTLLTSKKEDDMGNKWYSYDEYEEAPTGVRFNIRKLSEGRIQYELKNEHGKVHTFIGNEDKKQMYDAKFTSSGIPGAFKDKAISTFDANLYQEQILSKEAVSRAKGYVKNFKDFAADGMGLYIYSKSESSGKTHLISAIANELMARHNVSVKFVSALNFFLEMKRNISSDKSDPYVRSNLFDSTIQANVLIIDDLGAGSQSPYVSDLIYELISKRAQNNKVTLFTSKRAFSDLKYDNSTLMIIQQKCLSITLPNENIAKVLIKDNNRKYEDMLKA